MPSRRHKFVQERTIFLTWPIYLHLTLENKKIVPDVNSNYLEDNATNTLIGQKHFWNLFFNQLGSWLVQERTFFLTHHFIWLVQRKTRTHRDLKKKGDWSKSILIVIGLGTCYFIHSLWQYWYSDFFSATNLI